jgi:hypothetical protein
MAPEAQGPQPAEPLTDGTAEATAITGAALDLATALKAAQILSSEIPLDSLLETMMAVVIEQAGAQRGVFPAREMCAADLTRANRPSRLSVGPRK